MANKRVLTCIGALALAVVPLFLASGAAEAVAQRPHPGGPPPPPQKIKKHKKSYTETFTFRDKSQHRCVIYTVTGGFTWDTQVQEPSGDVEWTKQKLSPQPTFRAHVHPYSTGNCTRRASLYEISMTQHWSGWSCSFDPSFSFSVPWGVGVSFWPNCGNKSQVHYSSGYGRNTHYTQYTNGVPPVEFGGYGGFPDDPPCYGVYVSSQNYIADNSSNIYQSGTRKICLPA